MSKEKPKTAAQINTPLMGNAKSLSQSRRYSAICTQCRAQIKAELIREIEKHSILTAIIHGSSGNDREFTFKESWWQQFKKEK